MHGVLRIELTPRSGELVCDVPGNSAVITIMPGMLGICLVNICIHMQVECIN